MVTCDKENAEFAFSLCTGFLLTLSECSLRTMHIKILLFLAAWRLVSSLGDPLAAVPANLLYK